MLYGVEHRLLRCVDLAEVGERIERAYAGQLQGSLKPWFAGVRRTLRPMVTAGGGPIPASVGLQLDAQAETPVLDRLALPRRLHERDGRRVLVVFDEFQDVLGAQDRADAVIRSEIQHHGNAASYVFAGSQVGMMRELFADKRRAFYGQATPVALPPLPPGDVADYVAKRFEASGRGVGAALDPLLATAQGHPQRTMLLAHCLWDATPPGETATEETWVHAYDQAMRDVQDELRAIWGGLSVGQRRALVTVAGNVNGLYAAARAEGGSRGGAVRTATDALVDAGELVEDPGTRSGYRVVDPLLAAWIGDGRSSA